MEHSFDLVLPIGCSNYHCPFLASICSLPLFLREKLIPITNSTAPLAWLHFEYPFLLTQFFTYWVWPATSVKYILKCSRCTTLLYVQVAFFTSSCLFSTFSPVRFLNHVLSLRHVVWNVFTFICFHRLHFDIITVYLNSHLSKFYATLFALPCFYATLLLVLHRSSSSNTVSATSAHLAEHFFSLRV